MPAIGFFLEVLVWLLPWSIVATRFAMSFNEPTARLGGMPGRVWAALILTWTWLLTMTLWPASGYARWLGAVTLLSAPCGALLEALFVARRHLGSRGRALAVAAVVGSAAAVATAVAAFVHTDSQRDSGDISMVAFDSVKLGQSESSVLAQLGKPMTQQEVGYTDPPPGDECIYYGDSGIAVQGGTTYRLCFRGGVLAFKDGSGGSFDAPTSTPS